MGGYRKQLKGYYHGINRFIGKGYSKPSIELFRDADYLDTYVPKHEYGHFISQLAGFSKGKRNLGEFFGQMGINKLPNDELFADIYSRLVENPIYNVGKNSQYADEILSFIQKFKSGTFGSVDELIEKSKINLNKNKGLIPNFNALSQAISRENSAGIQMSQIRVGQSSNLKSNLNPLGLGVFNTRDEPLGLNQGINRTKSMGLDPKKSGGFIIKVWFQVLPT